MPGMQSEVVKTIEELNEALAMQILKAKIRFVHICLAAIMPKELYDLASHENQLDRCQKWANDQGYCWHEVIGETRLVKGGLVAARFRPIVEGDVQHRKCTFFANVLGKPVNVAVENPLLN